MISDFELDEKKRTNDGLIFTWKKDRIEPGEKISVEYILRKRVERSIILRKENKVSVVNLYHSIKQEMQANLNFVNTSGKVFHEILIEDVIPPELIVNQTEANKKNNCTRTILDIKIKNKKGFIIIELTADGFLYNMVRIIVGTLIHSGLGKLNKNDILEIFKSFIWILMISSQATLSGNETLMRRGNLERTA